VQGEKNYEERTKKHGTLISTDCFMQGRKKVVPNPKLIAFLSLPATLGTISQ